MTFDYSIDYHVSSRLEFNLAHRYQCLMNKNYQEPDNLDYAFIFNIIILVYNVIEFILSILRAYLMAVNFHSEYIIMHLKIPTTMAIYFNFTSSSLNNSLFKPSDLV